LSYAWLVDEQSFLVLLLFGAAQTSLLSKKDCEAKAMPNGMLANGLRRKDDAMKNFGRYPENQL